MEKNKIFSKVYILNLVVNALAFLSFNMSISGFPILISKINSSYIVLGLVTSCSAITSLLIRPFVGLIAERFSSFRIILLGIFFMFISPLLCIISDNGVLYLFMRALQGVGWGFTSTICSTLISKSVPQERISEGIGYAGFVSSTVSAFAPALSVYIFNHSTGNLMLSIISIAALFSLVLLFFEKAEIESFDSRNENSHKVVFFQKEALPPAIMIFLVTFSYSPIVTYIMQYSLEKFDVDNTYFFICYGIATVIIRPLTGLFVDKHGGEKIALLSIIFSVFSLILLFKGDSVISVYVSGCVSGLSMGIGMNSMQTLSIIKTPKAKHNYAMATFLFGFDLGMASGSFIAGLMVTHFGLSKMFGLIAAVPILYLAIYFVLSVYQLRKHKKKEFFCNQ